MASCSVAGTRPLAVARDSSRLVRRAPFGAAARTRAVQKLRESRFACRVPSCWSAHARQSSAPRSEELLRRCPVSNWAGPKRASESPGARICWSSASPTGERCRRVYTEPLCGGASACLSQASGRWKAMRALVVNTGNANAGTGELRAGGGMCQLRGGGTTDRLRRRRCFRFPPA